MTKKKTDNKFMPKTRYGYIMAKFYELGITVQSMAELVYDGQKPYEPDITMAYAMERVEKVLHRREVQHALLVALFLDESAQKGIMPEPLQSIVASDDGLFGVDETIAISAAGLGGSIATSNFGALDKNKSGIIGRLNNDQKEGKLVSTFLDDMISAIVAIAEGSTAHTLGAPENDA